MKVRERVWYLFNFHQNAAKRTQNNKIKRNTLMILNKNGERECEEDKQGQTVH